MNVKYHNFFSSLSAQFHSGFGLLQSLIYKGTKFGNDLEQSKKIILTNQIIILIGLITAFESIVYFWMGVLNGFLITLVMAFLYSFCFILNSYGFLTSARISLLLLFNLAIFIYTLMLGTAIGMHYVYFLSMIIPLIIFDKHQFIIKVFFTTLPFLLFFILMTASFIYPAPIIDLGSYQSLFHFMVIAATGICLISIFYFYFSMYEVTKNILSQFFKQSSLTQREIEIVSKILEGCTNKDIGKSLYIEESTVKRHVKNIFKKLRVKKRTELMAFAMKND